MNPTNVVHKYDWVANGGIFCDPAQAHVLPYDVFSRCNDAQRQSIAYNMAEGLVTITTQLVDQAGTVIHSRTWKPSDTGLVVETVAPVAAPVEVPMPQVEPAATIVTETEPDAFVKQTFKAGGIEKGKPLLKDLMGNDVVPVEQQRVSIWDAGVDKVATAEPRALTERTAPAPVENSDASENVAPAAPAAAKPSPARSFLGSGKKKK